MFEVSDFDEDIKARESLLEEARNLEIPTDWNEANRVISGLKRKWKRIAYWESAYEDTLADQFDQCFEAFYEQRKEKFGSNQKLKEDLIEKAHKLSNSTDWKKTAEEMNELMQQWKAIGTTGKTTDDTLWNAFNDARQIFYDNKRKHLKDMQANFENARKVKTDLIAKAADMCNSDDWKDASEQFRTMMDTWKAAGNAGRDHDDALWEAFNGHRQTFYDRRNAHYEEFQEQQAKSYEMKKEVITHAEEIASKKEYTRENTEAMKAMGQEWKTLGFSGKDKEDQIWKEFRAVMDLYFDGLRQWNEERRKQWHQKLLGVKNRKLDLLTKQKHQIENMQKEIASLLGEAAIEDMEAAIQDKQAFIQQLENEIEDINKTLDKES